MKCIECPEGSGTGIENFLKIGLKILYFRIPSRFPTDSLLGFPTDSLLKFPTDSLLKFPTDSLLGFPKNSQSTYSSFAFCSNIHWLICCSMRFLKFKTVVKHCCIAPWLPKLFIIGLHFLKSFYKIRFRALKVFLNLWIIFVRHFKFIIYMRFLDLLRF